MKKLFLLALVLYSLGTYSQTFYSILIADVNDGTIGPSCRVDQAIMLTQLNAISEGIGYDFKNINITGNTFNFDMIKTTLENIKCSGNDIIFLYYTGHGVNVNSRNSIWPSIDLRRSKSASPGDIYNDEHYPLDIAHSIIKKKGARLCITMGDCCNKELPTYQKPLKKNLEIVIDDPNRDVNRVYSSLFLDPKGDILLSSCQKGQYSYSHNENGSFYTDIYHEAFMFAVNYGNEVSWEALLADTKNRLSKLNFPMGEQVPQYVINLSGGPSPSPSPSPNPDNITYASINEYLNNIVDESINSAERRKLLNNKLRYFADDGFVEIYINKTMVEPMAVDDYINRIFLMAKSIESINFIENKSEKKSNNGKVRKLAVQELWLN